MRKIVFDFKRIETEAELNKYLAETLNLPGFINGDYGYNLAAFKDLYSYWDDSDFFELINTYNASSIHKEVISSFVEILKDLKKTNPNFDFIITS